MKRRWSEEIVIKTGDHPAGNIGHTSHPVRVFVSYAREDSVFINRLRTVLEEAGVEVSGDWLFTPGMDYEPQIFDAIAGSEHLLFVISIDSVRSQACRDELREAAKLGKSILPILFRQPNDETELPLEVRSPQWMMLRPEDDFSKNSAQLVETIHTNFELLRFHTFLGQRAADWAAKGHSFWLLLRGSDLQEALQWLPQATAVPDRSPIPTPLQTEYVLASQRGWRKWLVGLVVTVSFVAMGFAGLSVFAFFQKNSAIRERNTAIARQLMAQSAQMKEESPQLSLLLAVESQHTAARNKKPYLPEVETNLLGLLHSIGGSPLTGHSTQVRTTQFSPDGRWVISSSSDSVRLWDLRGAEGTARPAAPLLGQKEGVLNTSPDGSLLVTVEGEKAHIWNLRVDSPADARIDLPGDTSDLVFSSDGHWLAGVQGGRIRLWQTAQASRGAQASRVLQEPAGEVTQVLFTMDGARLFTGTDSGVIGMWDLQNGKEPKRQAFPLSLSGAIIDMQVSPDGKWLAVSGETEGVNLLNLSSMSAKALPPSKGFATRQFAFSPDSRWFAMINGDNWQLPICDLLESQDQACRSLKHTSDFAAMTFSPDSTRLITGSADATARVWNLTGADAFQNPLVLHGHSAEIRAIAITQDSRWLATASRDDTIRLWDLNAEDPVASSRVLRGLESLWSGTNYGVDHVAFSPDGRWLLGTAYEPMPRVWDLSTGLIGRLPLLAKGCEDHDSSVCGERAWKVANVKGSRALLDVQGQSRSQPASGLVIEPIEERGSAGPDGRYRVMRLADKTVSVCEVDSSGLCATLDGNARSIQFSPDGHWLLAYKSNASELWADLYNLRNLPKAKPFRMDINPWTKASFDRCGRWLVDKNEKALWRLDSTEPSRRELTGHKMPINDQAFSLDGRWLATSSLDVILLWALTDEASKPIELDLQGLVDANDPFAPPVSFSADSRWLAMLTKQGVYVWPLEIEKIMEFAYQTAGRRLTDEEWHKYISLELPDQLPMKILHSIDDPAH